MKDFNSLNSEIKKYGEYAEGAFCPVSLNSKIIKKCEYCGGDIALPRCSLWPVESYFGQWDIRVPESEESQDYLLHIALENRANELEDLYPLPLESNWKSINVESYQQCTNELCNDVFEFLYGETRYKDFRKVNVQKRIPRDHWKIHEEYGPEVFFVKSVALMLDFEARYIKNKSGEIIPNKGNSYTRRNNAEFFRNFKV